MYTAMGLATNQSTREEFIFITHMLIRRKFDQGSKAWGNAKKTKYKFVSRDGKGREIDEWLESCGYVHKQSVLHDDEGLGWCHWGTVVRENGPRNASRCDTVEHGVASVVWQFPQSSRDVGCEAVMLIM